MSAYVPRHLVPSLTSTLALAVALSAQGVWEAPFDQTIAPPLGTDPTLAGAPAWPIPAFGQPAFTAIHMALLPRGPYQGHVLMWNGEENGSLSTTPLTHQRYVIMDPSPGATTRFRNFWLPTNPSGNPNGPGDLFCAGHCFTPDGSLFVAGGTKIQSPLVGGFNIWVFDPELANPNYPGTFGRWTDAGTTVAPRWYPTATLTRFDLQVSGATIPVNQILVTGGIGGTSAGISVDTYEAFFLFPRATGQVTQLLKDTRTSGSLPAGLFPGPLAATGNDFFYYPRMFFLQNGRVLHGGMNITGGSLLHDATNVGNWDPVPGAMNPVPQPILPGAPLNAITTRDYDSQVLEPITPLTPSIGMFVGKVGGESFGISTDVTEFCGADVTATPWMAGPRPSVARDRANLVLLPNGDQLLVGGQRTFVVGLGQPLVTVFEQTPEVFSGFAWSQLAPQVSPRDYHSTALLLPDGRVLTASGENRTSDFEIFQPPYLARTRPVGATLPAVPFDTGLSARVVHYGQTLTLSCTGFNGTANAALQRVTATAPCSITHHSDMHQRLIELAVQSTSATSIDFALPTNPNLMPPGYYMLWAISADGGPADAIWVKLQQ